MRLKILAAPLFVIALLSVIYASERITQVEEPIGPVQVSYWEKWTGFEGDAMQAVVNRFNAKQNRIHVNLVTVSDIQNKTLLAVAGGDPPDVAGLYGPNLAQYADDNAVLALDDLCASHGIRSEQYIPVYWEIGHYRGHVYALPSTPASTALHVNLALFKKAGLDINHLPQTIEEMDAAGARITTRDSEGHIDISGFMPAEPGWWNWGWGYIFGGKLWDGTTRLTANAPENVRAYDWVQSFSRKYGSSELQNFRSGFGNFSSPQNAFLSSKVAMEIQGVWMYNFIHENAPDMESPVRTWSAIPFPHPADRPDLAGLTFVDEDILAIPRGAAHPKEAFEFIAYVQSQEGMELLCLGQRKNSPLQKVSEGFYSKHPNPFIRLFSQMPRGKNVVSPPKMAIWSEYQDELNNAFQQVSLEKMSAKEALDYVQARMQPKMDAYQERARMREAQEQRDASAHPGGSGL